jgi:hypothetical protein
MFKQRQDISRSSAPILADAAPPIALDKFIEESGLSACTIWRYRRKGWLRTVNLCGRHYVLRSEIARFNARAAAGEFAKAFNNPKSQRAPS